MDFDSAGENLRQEFSFSEQTIDTLLDRQLWINLCPHLHIDDNFRHLREETKKSNADLECLGDSLNDKGYFRLTPEQLSIPLGVTELLAIGVKRLVAYGYKANFILMYDEAWFVGDIIGNQLIESSGNRPIGDWFCFYVDPSNVESYMPGAPHRDRPTADEHSFRQNGAPKYCSAWLALTDATPENSCLYFLPKPDDTGYYVAGDDMVGILPTPASWQRIVAQPLLSGGLVAFSHRLLHWGSMPLVSTVISPSRPRIALSLAYADPSFELSYFDHEINLPYPEIGLRLGLVAGQQIQYEHLSPLDKGGIAIFRRIFYSQKKYFAESYFDKITSAVQFLEFKRKQKIK